MFIAANDLLAGADRLPDDPVGRARPFSCGDRGFARDARSRHPYRHLAVLAEVRLLAGDACLDEFERGHGGACRAVPQLGGERAHAQYADIRIVRTLPPHVVAALPDFRSLGVIASHLGARGDRKIRLGLSIDEHEPDIVLGLDLVLLAAAEVGDEPDEAGVAFRPGLHGSRPHSTREGRGQHGDADLLDDVPDAIGARAALAGHVKLTFGYLRGSDAVARSPCHAGAWHTASMLWPSGSSTKAP